MKAKRLISLLLTLMMVVSAFATIAINVSAADVTVDSITNLGKRTKLGKNLASDAITYTGNDVLDKAVDGDYSTGACSTNLSQDYTPSIVFDKATGKFAVQNESYNDVLIIKLSATTTLNDMTVWGGDNKNSTSFMNNAFSIF